MEALFLKLVNLSINAGWLVLIILLFRLLFKRAPKWSFCLLWGLVALRLVCPVSIETNFSLLPSSEPLPKDIIYTATPQIQSGISAIDNVVNPILSATMTADPVNSVNPTQIWSFILSHIWLLGMIAMVLYVLGSYLLLKYRVADATILRDNIKQSEHIVSPFVLGFLRPVIYLPYRIDDADTRHIISHEQAHIRRKDHWWKPVGFLLLSVYWFHPLMWVSYILLCRDIELACDEKVIKEMAKDDRRAYSTALLNCSVHRRRVAACPLAFGEVSVKDRVKNVMNYKKPAFWMILLAVISCIIVAVCLLTDPKTDDRHFTDTELSMEEIYWTLPVEDYEISLRDGVEENTLEIWIRKADAERSILSFAVSNDIQTLDDIKADTFEDILGYSGFRIHRFYTVADGTKYFHTEYYAMEEELFSLAYASGEWENWDTNSHAVDLDGDGIRELLCDWSIDGVTDTLIFHHDGEGIALHMGTHVALAENNDYEIPEYDSVGSRYLPEKNKILVWYREKTTQEIIEKEYDIDLLKLKQWYEHYDHSV